MIVKNNIASEGGHWYHRDTGESVYQVKAKNGSMRNTTLRDARVMNLVPSVSGIIGVMASEGLVQWRINNTLMSALTLPKIEGETVDQFGERVKVDSKEQSAQAMDTGTRIHKSIELYMQGERDVEFPLHAESVVKAMEKHFGERPWEGEVSFAHKHYGGKTDCIDFLGDGIVIDFKSKDFTDPAKVVAYDNLPMQLSAYREGFLKPKARCANIFVSVQNPELTKVIEYRDEELQRAWAMFQCCLRLWQLKNNYE